MKLESKHVLKNLAFVSTLFGVLSLYSFNCAPPSFKVANESGSLVLASSDLIIPIDEASSTDLSPKTELPYALLTGDQMFNSFINLTDQPNFSNTIRSEFGIRQGAMATNTSLNQVNAPMLIAITSLAGEVCNGLITKEQAIMDATQRKFFSLVDFNRPVANLTDVNFKQTVNTLTQSVWGRSPSSEEDLLFSQYKADFVAAIPPAQLTQNNQTRNLILSTCASILGTLDTITY